MFFRSVFLLQDKRHGVGYARTKLHIIFKTKAFLIKKLIIICFYDFRHVCSLRGEVNNWGIKYFDIGGSLKGDAGLQIAAQAEYG